MIYRCLSSDVHYHSASLLQHGWQSCLCKDKARTQIQIEHSVEDVGVRLPKLHTASVTAYGIHYNIETDVTLDQAVDHPGDGNTVCHVYLCAFERVRVDTSHELQCIEFIRIAIGYRHFG